MKNMKLFEHELSLIKNPDLRAMTAEFMEKRVPDYFWFVGASSSGKYHPVFSQGEGGLVRHTKAVVMFAEELLRMNTYGYMRDDYKDYVIVACIVHDTAKYGKYDYNKDEYADHAENAATMFANWCKHEYDVDVSELLVNAIKAHMGQWSTNKEDKPFNGIDRCVHMADYMASRSFIDIPDIVMEWDALKMGDERR